MSLQLILGGSGRGKTYYIQHLLSEEARKFPERNYIFIVPEQFTMQTQKELISVREVKGIMNIEVQSFLRLAFRVFDETGFCHVPVLDDMDKTMILKEVLENMEDELEYFGRNIHKRGYVREIKSFLSELMQYGADEETLDEMIEAAGKHPALMRKLQDMKKIYTAFREYLEDHYITSEEILTVLSDVAEYSELLRDSIVCLDGFTGFTPTQYRFIEKLLVMSEKVYITVTMDRRESIAKMGPKHGLFYMSQHTMVRLRKIARDRRVEVCPEIWTGEKAGQCRFAEGGGLNHLEKALFRYPVQCYEKKPEDISVHILKQPENEVNFVAEKVMMLLQEKSCRYRDIAVVTGNLEVYGVLANEVFARCGIPCFVDRKKNILEHPFIELIRGVLDIFQSNFKAEKVMLFEKNIFSNATEEQSYLLDNFLRATGVRGYKKWCSIWKAADAFRGKDPQQMYRLNLELDTVRLETVEQIGGLYERIGKGRHTVLEYVQAICEWMEEQRYYIAIKKLEEKFQEEGELSLSREYSQIYEIVLGVLDRLAELLGGETMVLKEFRELLDTGFDEARIGLIPPGVDQVLVGDINRTRLAHIKHLFFLGMNDCNLPKGGGRGGVISDSERLFLAEEEFELAPTVRDTVYTEQYYLYLNLTKPSDHLYLTFCESGNDGKAQNPAYIIERVCKLFPELEITVEEQRRDDRHLLGTSFGVEYLIDGLRKKRYGDKKWRQIFSYYMSEEKRKEMTLKLLEASFYRETKTSLSKEVVRLLYQDTLTASISQFERYSSCAFSYFMRYGLQLHERMEHQVAFFDIGNIVHDALDLYTQKLIAEGRSWEDVSEEEQHIEADQCINKAVERYRNGLLYSTERDTYLIERLRRILDRTIWAITKQMGMGKFQTVDSEFSFEALGEKRGDEVLQEFEKEEPLLRLIGRIDRIDKMKEENVSFIKIVDYKTGREGISLSNLYYGLQLQLMIYLKAATREEAQKAKKLVIPAGILYYNIDDPIVECKEKDSAEKKILYSLRMDGLVNKDMSILQSMDQSLLAENGELACNVESSVIPVETDKYGELKKRSKTLVTEDFEHLLEYTDEKLLEIKKQIFDGKIEVNPYMWNNASGENACVHCPYHSICRFDRRIPGNHYRMLEKLSDEEVMYHITHREDKAENGEEEWQNDEAAGRGEEDVFGRAAVDGGAKNSY